MVTDKKQIKFDYKQSVKPMGIFQIRNLVNGKLFIGGTFNLDVAYNKHKFQLNLGSHKNKDLQKEWREHGQENFIYEILEVLEQDDNIYRDYNDELKVLEECWLEKIQSFGDQGYNKPPRRK